MVANELERILKESISETKKIVLYNDDFNTFENVIKCLIDYCKHNFLQAEQCATIVHNNGKCVIKSGSFDDLLPIYIALIDNKLKVEIE